MTKYRPKPVVLIILDGWGVATPSRANALSQAKTPTFDRLIKLYPTATLLASGEAVGLPKNEAGNSEAGHINLGAGRVVYQDLPKIDQAIKDGSFFDNEKLLQAIEFVKKNKSALHLAGLISTAGVHSSISHLYALLELAAKSGLKKVFVHAFLDGRDMNYNSGLELVEKLEQKFSEYGVGKVATLSGRFFAMDRDNYFERTQRTYEAMVFGDEAKKFESAKEAIQKSYEKKIYDEEFLPAVISEKGRKTTDQIKDNDAVIFFNFKADRMRQLTKALALPDFNNFSVKKFKKLHLTSLTEYENGLPVEAAFPPEIVEEPLAKVIEIAGLNQLHVAETEKYAHNTFFFNGEREEPFQREERILVPSPRVASYEQKPAMSAKAIAKKTAEAIMAEKYDFIVVNFANADVVAHSGNLKATIKAVEAVDNSLKQIVEVVLGKNGVAIITADHGNAEEMVNLQSGGEDKDHSVSPVPFILVGKDFEGKTIGGVDAPNSDLSLLRPAGKLADVAPTILKIMNLNKPKEMTGKSLI